MGQRPAAARTGRAARRARAGAGDRRAHDEAELDRSVHHAGGRRACRPRRRGAPAVAPAATHRRLAARGGARRLRRLPRAGVHDRRADLHRVREARRHRDVDGDDRSGAQPRARPLRAGAVHVLDHAPLLPDRRGARRRDAPLGDRPPARRPRPRLGVPALSGVPRRDARAVALGDHRPARLLAPDACVRRVHRRPVRTDLRILVVGRRQGGRGRVARGADDRDHHPRARGAGETAVVRAAGGGQLRDARCARLRRRGVACAAAGGGRVRRR